MEGSGAGSVLVTNGSGCGSGRPKNIRILPIRMRIWIRNTAVHCRVPRNCLTKEYLEEAVVGYLGSHVLADEVNRVGLVQVQHVVEQLRGVLELVFAEHARCHLHQRSYHFRGSK
jgi:hypothetical protein